MNKIIFLIFFVAFTANISGQINIIGKTNKQELLKSEHKFWFEDTYNSYNPNPEIVKDLTKLFKKSNFKVDVYFGTWCEDSQIEIPKLIKLLEQSQFDLEKLNLFGVDEDKVIPNITEKKKKILNLFNVPSIIVYENGIEINRFVEYTQESLEEDMLKIFSKKQYKHSYYN
jgi:thiol-disulfide isomerase/thioredoxin